MKKEIKHRVIDHWRSSIIGLLLIVAAIYLIESPTLSENSKLIFGGTLLAGGLFCLGVKDPKVLSK